MVHEILTGRTYVCPTQVFKVVYPCWPSPHNVLVLQAEDVRRVADSELGFQQVTLSRPTQAKTYLFINTERMVVGCLVAEPIRQVGVCGCVGSFSQLSPTLYNKQCLLMILHHTGVMSWGCDQFNWKVTYLFFISRVWTALKDRLCIICKNRSCNN